MVAKPLLQCYGILIKNFSNHWTNKKKFLGEFFFPLLISIFYVLMQKQKKQNPLIGMVFSVLLKMYIAMIGMSAVRQLVTMFLTQRENKFRQYQHIFGLSFKYHTLSNLFYMQLYMSLFLLPFYLTLSYYEFKIEYIFMFGSFVISSLTLTLMLTSFFKDHKIASQIVGMFFSLSSMLALLYSGGQKNSQGQIVYSFVDYLAMIIPNSSFSIAIMYKNIYSSFLSFALVKIYVLVYSFVQFPDQYKQCFQSCKNKIYGIFGYNKEQRNGLIQQFNLNQQIIQGSPPNNNHQSSDDFSGNKNYIIKISNLVKIYKIKQGQFNALNSITFNIKKRQIFGLLGRNGAGKTTLVDILTNVTKQNTGYFIINYEKQQKQGLQRIGICYQHEILYEQLTGEQHLYFYSRIKNISTDIKQTVQNIVQKLKINDEYKKKVKQLSGGNKRKLSVAIALLGNPQLLIFDEPTSGLDPLSRRSVWEILQNLKKDSNSSIILTTHHLDQAQVLSDNICVIQKGKVIVHSTPQQIKQKYGNGYYLTIQYNNEYSVSKDIRSSINQIKQYLQNKLQKIQQIEQQNNIVKFFMKFSKMSQKQFQFYFIEVIEWLQSKQNLKIQIQANNLEQSFIAILKDPQNTGNMSGQSIDLNNRIVRPLNFKKSFQDYQNQSIFQKIYQILRQTWGIFLRCIYFHKGQLLKFTLIYNVNILIFFFAMLFNKYIMNIIQQQGNDISSEFQEAIQSQKNYKKEEYSNNMLILQGYIIMASAFIGIPIYQKQKNIRRVFNSRGLSKFAYWFGNFCFDFGYYLINLVIMAKFISPKSFQFTGQRGLWIFIELGIGMIIYTYTISNFFSKITTANTWFSIVNMILGFMILPMVIIGKDTFLRYLSFIKYLYPYYDLNVLIINSGLKDIKNLQKMMGNKNQLGDDGGPYIYYTIILYFTLLVLIELRIIDKIKSLWNKQKIQRIDKNIKLQTVYKKYGQIQALKNVNYYVSDERLALLGHNGAGKSTTFGILSGQINQDCGQVYLQYHKKLKYQKIMRSSGICYQQNCLWQNLTPLQIFSIFQWIVPIQNSDKQIQWMLQSLQFQTMNYNKRFQNLSGGNKRKICMAVALFGDPSIRLLDQCSTGLDPSSRLAMVQTIKQSQNGSTIFTTHSMGQAQNLCSKAVIMNKGQVLQFDYIYKLKQKYYNCFWIDLILKKIQQQQNINELKIKISRIQQIMDKIHKINNKFYPTQKPKILLACKSHKIRIQFSKQNWKLNKSLTLISKLKQKLNQDQNMQYCIESIELCQPKLQDVYIRVTKNQVQYQQNEYQYENINNKNQDNQQQLVQISFDK